MIDRFYEKLSEYLGSSLIVGLFALWLIIHTVIDRDYLSFISEAAILFGMLILRAETVATRRMEQQNKKIIRRVE